MKYFLSSTLTVLCVLNNPLQALAEVQGEASASATELSTREPQFIGGLPDIGQEAYQIQVPDWLSALAASFLRAGANVNAREDNAAGLLWPPRRRPISRIRRPVYIRPRPRPRPRRRPPPRRPNKNINVNGANGGTNIGGNGANGGNIRVTRDIRLEAEDKSSVAKREGNQRRQGYRGSASGGGRRYGGGGSRAHGGHRDGVSGSQGGGGGSQGHGGGRRYGGGGGHSASGGRRYGGGGGGGHASATSGGPRHYGGGGRRRGGGGAGGPSPTTADVNIKDAHGGTNNVENGEKGGDVQGPAVEA